MIAQPKGRIAGWKSFLERNKAWLTTKEVPLAMVKGSEKAANPVLQQVANESRVVVSVYEGGPITILEPVAAAKPQAGEPGGGDQAGRQGATPNKQ